MDCDSDWKEKFFLFLKFQLEYIWKILNYDQTFTHNLIYLKCLLFSSFSL